MRAVLFRARTGARRRVRWAVLLTVAIALAAGVSLAALAGARRTDSAVDRFLTYTEPAQGVVAGDPGLYSQIGALPQVASSQQMARMAMQRLGSDGRPVPGDTLGEIAVSNFAMGRPIIVGGRAPGEDRLDEVAVNASAARNAHLRVGSVLRLRAYGPDQADQILEGTRAAPTGPTVSARVVGVFRFPADLSAAQLAPGVTFAGQDTVIFTPAFMRTYVDEVAVVGGVFLSFRLHSDAELPSFRADVHRLSAGQAQIFLGSDDVDAATVARHATSLEALALLLFGILAGVVTLTFIAQAFARQVYLDADENPAERAMGMVRSQLVAVEVIRVAAVVVVGVLLAIGVAVAISPRMPVGLARQAEIDRGYSFDGFVLGVGALLVVVMLVGWTALIAWRATGSTVADPNAGRGRPRHSSWVVKTLRRAGSAPSATVGATMAFESGHGRGAVPVRTALASAVIAVAVVVGALTFGVNLSRLAEHPALQGWNWDVAVGNPHSDDVSKTAIPRLTKNPQVAAFTAIAGGESIAMKIDGHEGALFGAETVEGQDLVPYTAGRAPVAEDEIALGARSMRDLHVGIGDRVRVTTGGPTRTMRVTGRVLLTPSVVNNSVQLGQGAVVGAAALRSLHADAPVNVFLVRFSPNVDTAAATARLEQEFPGEVLLPNRPPDIENLRRVDRLPGLLALLFTIIALLTIGNTLVNSARRRRHELAVLRTIGFVRRQVSGAVAWQATMTALVAIVIGIPVGAAAGRVAWNAVTHGLGLPDSAILPVSLLVFVALVSLVAANLMAIAPGVVANRVPPATILHGE